MPKKNFGTKSILPEISSPSTENFQTTSILHQLHGVSQDFTKKIGTFYQLKNLINQHQLTESLEMLEKSGISGDFALFITQNIQTLEVV